MNKSKDPVSRVVRRRAKPGSEKTYEALVKGMLEASSRFDGYLYATVIPPHGESDNGEYQIVQSFASAEDLARWDASEERAMWHDRILPVAESDPSYRLLSGLEVWFPLRQGKGAAPPPPRWKMTVVSWLGIFPAASTCLAAIGSLLDGWPYLGKMAIVTAMVAILMSYVIMPRLSVWMRWWLKR